MSKSNRSTPPDFRAARERRQTANLVAGIALLLNHPELPSCEDCSKYLYDDEWRQTRRRGLPVLRADYGGKAPTPCPKCPKIPRGVVPRPENATKLSEANWRAYHYYRQCVVDTTGILPRDRLVVRNNALIRMVEDSVVRAKADLSAVALALLGGKANG